MKKRKKILLIFALVLFGFISFLLVNFIFDDFLFERISIRKECYEYKHYISENYIAFETVRDYETSRTHDSSYDVPRYGEYQNERNVVFKTINDCHVFSDNNELGIIGKTKNSKYIITIDYYNSSDLVPPSFKNQSQYICVNECCYISFHPIIREEFTPFYESEVTKLL